MSEAIVNRILEFVAIIGRFGIFFSRVIQVLFTTLPDWKLVLEQMYRIGVTSLPVIAAVCILAGSTLSLVGIHIFKEFGGQNMIGLFIGLSCIREMSPILVGAMMASKPGTDIAATIATMRVKEQIDALEVMAINPIWFLIIPRLIAFVFVAPFLVIFADFLAVAAGYVVSVYQFNVNGGTYIADVIRYLSVQDLYNGMIKGAVFAVVTCVIACFYGFTSAPGPKGVSMAINRSVVLISSLIVILNYFMTEIMYGKVS